MNIRVRDKVLVFAILFSAIWHIFWLSAFTVVVVPKVKKPVKFSSVAFLGPILDSSVLSVNVKSYERTEQEARYLDSIGMTWVFLSADATMGVADAIPVFDALSEADEEDFMALAISRIDADKMEPGRDVN